jgi:arylsulfatase A
MHVPLIANWPGHVPAGKVSDDLIDSTDFFPTICDVADVKIPASLTIDGRSFAPQLMGEAGKPRDWIYMWYAKDGGPKAQSEFAMSKSLKVYSDGRVFDLRNDPFEQKALKKSDLQGDDVAAVGILQAAIDQYANARPDKLLASQAVKKAGKGKGQKARGGKRRAARLRDAS